MTSTTINEQVTKHLEEIELEIETSSAYFKPNPGKVYLIKIDPQRDKIVPIQNALSNNILDKKMVSDDHMAKPPRWRGWISLDLAYLTRQIQRKPNQFATIIKRGGEM